MDGSIRGAEAVGFSITNTDGKARAPKGEGTLYCDLYQGPIFGRTLAFDGDAAPSSPIFDGEKAEAKVANVECTLYPHDRGDVTELRRALRDLRSR